MQLESAAASHSTRAPQGNESNVSRVKIPTAGRKLHRVSSGLRFRSENCSTDSLQRLPTGKELGDCAISLERLHIPVTVLFFPKFAIVANELKEPMTLCPFKVALNQEENPQGL